jgi:hypothetical protein
MSTRRQKPIDFAAEGLCLASLSIPTAESGVEPGALNLEPTLVSLHAGGLGRVSRNGVHQSRGQTIVRLQAKIL